MLSDIQIAQSAEMLPIGEIARGIGLSPDDIIPYGKYKAKVAPQKPLGDRHGRLILVTAINPTAAGEGKTTTSIGLADALSQRGCKSILCLREPSLGPVFGMKGGAAGGGYSQVVPMEDINLHFTGDIHAIGAANNLLAAMIDNSIHQGNPLGIDPQKVTWRRCMDMNDRQLRYIQSGLGGKANGTPRDDGFDITVASEVMAVVCLAKDLADLKERLSRIVCAYTFEGKPVTAADLKAQGAMAALLKEAVLPNLVQTLEHTPALIHGGPFANIAHGCSSVAATELGLRLADYVVTEAGFGADLGAEKFLDIKCRQTGLCPDAVVIVATVRALKSNGGAEKENLGNEDLEALKRGIPNLMRHIDNIRNVFGLECCVALNHFPSDTEAEIAMVKDAVGKAGVKMALSRVFALGGDGGLELADTVIGIAERQGERKLSYTYPSEMSLEDKIREVAKRIYRASDVEFSEVALEKLQRFTEMGHAGLPVCIAKTQYSFTDNAKILGAPEGFVFHVRDVRLSAGAGFVVAISGSIMTMPGLPKVPAAQNIDIGPDGVITGLF